MKIGAPKETFPGEARVAMTPDSAMQLQKLGHACLIEAGAGEAAGFSDAAYEAAGVTVVKTAAALWKEADIITKVREPSTTELKRLSADKSLDIVFLSRPERGASRSREEDLRHGHRDGHGAPDQPGAEDGCAVVNGQHRRLPRGHRGGQQLRALLHRTGHRRRQGAAREGARRRRGRGGACRHRHLDLARGDHLCLRRASRGGRADRVDGGRVRVPRIRRKLAGQFGDRRLRRAVEPRVPRKSSSRSSASSRPTSISSSPRRSFRAAPHRCSGRRTWSRR